MVNTMSVVPLLALKPHWFSRRFSSAMVDTSLEQESVKNFVNDGE